MQIRTKSLSWAFSLSLRGSLSPLTDCFSFNYRILTAINPWTALVSSGPALPCLRQPPSFSQLPNKYYPPLTPPHHHHWGLNTMEDLHPPTHSSFSKNVLSNSKVQDNSRSRKHGLQGNRTNKPKTPRAVILQLIHSVTHFLIHSTTLWMPATCQGLG